MSVLIKGMKMPHSCKGCLFCGHSSINEWELYCDITGSNVGKWDSKKWDNEWRSKDCPLIEVPTPHGRLIDADRTIDKAEMLMKEPSRETVDFMTIGYNHAVADCIAICKGVPTIIEAEEGEA